ncbi:MAG TPA: hypothetical protein VFE32_17535 [Puia sp.]|jgi:hypothetical protein|nr:hypothetical protein [Puia sp.]
MFDLMKANYVTQTNEVTIRDYSLLEDEGVGNLVEAAEGMGWIGVTSEYEDDELSPGKHMIVITAVDQLSLFRFLEHAEIPVYIIA